MNREALNVNRLKTSNVDRLSLIAKSLLALHGSRNTLVMLLLGMMAGCGTVGMPIPPEDLPVAQKLLKEEDREAKDKQKAIQGRKEEPTRSEEKPGEEAVVQEDITLPSLRPVGTR